MTSGFFHTTIKPNGRKYYYFRPPPSLKWCFGRATIRLSDDRSTAKREAAELLNKIPADLYREPTKMERSTARRLLNNAAGRALKRGLSVSLTIPEIIGMLRESGFRCAITRLPFDLNWRTGKTSKRNAYAPSLDRLDNASGYTKENCRIVLAAINYAMNEWGLEVYLTMAKAALRHGRIEQNGVRIDKPTTNQPYSVPICATLKMQETLGTAMVGAPGLEPGTR